MSASRGTPASTNTARSNRPARSRRTLVRWIKRGLWIVFLGAVAAAVVLAWMPKPVPVETATAARGELLVTVEEDGRTRVKDRYVVSAPLAGNLARIELRPGDAVQRGQVLARIVPSAEPLLGTSSRQQAKARVAASEAAVQQARAQVERAKAALQFAKDEAAQVVALSRQGVESEAARKRAELDRRARTAELTSAKFGARVADYELEMAKAAMVRVRDGKAGMDLEQLEVPSPIDGRVLQVIQESEGVVQAGTPLVELGDPSALEIVVDVLTQDAVRIERGAPAAIEQWGGEPLRANVRLVEPSAFTRMSALGVEEQRVNAVLDLEAPYEEWDELGDGYRIEASIVVWKADDVLKVPSSALFRHGDGWALFAVRDEVAVLVPVQVGQRSGLEAEIQSGLESGERVVVHPSDRIAGGTHLTWR